MDLHPITAMMTDVEDNDDILRVCKRLLQQQSFSTQDDIRHHLIDMGYTDISQSTVSRLLSRLGVAKTPNVYGKKVYCLTVENEPVRIGSSISSQVEYITHNQMVIVIKTHPGGAQLIARLLDTQPHHEILGTIAGIDTVMIAPRDISHIDQCESIIRSRLGLSL